MSERMRILVQASVSSSNSRTFLSFRPKFWAQSSNSKVIYVDNESDFLKFEPYDKLCVTTPCSYLGMCISCWNYINEANLQYLKHLNFITKVPIVKNTREI